MVSFQCHACGDVVKKPKLDQHRNYCHSGFDCIDCHTTFNSPMEYKGHTQCISEAEKYQKGLWKGAKPNRGNPRDPNVGMYQRGRGNRVTSSGPNSAPLGAPARMSTVIAPPIGSTQDATTDDGKKAGNQKSQSTAGKDNQKEGLSNLNGSERIDKNPKGDGKPVEPTSIPLPSSPEKIAEEGPDKTKEKKAKQAKKDKKSAEKSSESDEKVDVEPSASTEDATESTKKKDKLEKKKKRKLEAIAEDELQASGSTAAGGVKEKKSRKEKGDKQENAVDTSAKGKKSKKDTRVEGANEGDGEMEKSKKRKREDGSERTENLVDQVKDVKEKKKKKKHSDSQKEDTTSMDVDLPKPKTDASDGKDKKQKKDKKAKKSKDLAS